jgi:hypothetical protein
MKIQLYNPTDKPVEFRCGGMLYIFQPKETRDLDEYVANHAIERAHAPLVKYSPMFDKEVEKSDIVYSEMPWKKLVQMASARGIFTLGTKRPELEKLLEEYDHTQR